MLKRFWSQFKRQRIPEGCFIEMKRAVGICLLQGGRHDEADWYECYWLKLPVYGYHPVDYGRGEAWCRLVLFWHGKHGLKWWWSPVPGEKTLFY